MINNNNNNLVNCIAPHFYHLRQGNLKHVWIIVCFNYLSMSIFKMIDVWRIYITFLSVLKLSKCESLDSINSPLLYQWSLLTLAWWLPVYMPHLFTPCNATYWLHLAVIIKNLFQIFKKFSFNQFTSLPIFSTRKLCGQYPDAYFKLLYVL